MKPAIRSVASAAAAAAAGRGLSHSPMMVPSLKAFQSQRMVSPTSQPSEALLDDFGQMDLPELVTTVWSLLPLRSTYSTHLLSAPFTAHHSLAQCTSQCLTHLLSVPVSVSLTCSVHQSVSHSLAQCTSQCLTHLLSAPVSVSLLRSARLRCGLTALHSPFAELAF